MNLTPKHAILITSAIILGLSHRTNTRTAQDIFISKKYPTKNTGWFFSGSGNLVFDWEKSTQGLGENRPTEDDLPQYGWADDNQPASKKRKTSCTLKERVETFARLYKIHLMPKPDDIERIIDRITEAMLTDRLFEQLIDQIKITQQDLPIDATAFKKCTDNNAFLDSMNMPLPLIVIYPNPGRAQELVERLDSLLASFQGIQLKEYPDTVQPHIITCARVMGNTLTAESYVASRFSIPATTRDGLRTSTIIYYAQGNADNKFGLAEFSPESPVYEKLKQLIGTYPDVCSISNSILYAPLCCSLYDPRQNSALLRADYLGDVRDFHLYLPNRTTV